MVTVTKCNGNCYQNKMVNIFFNCMWIEMVIRWLQLPSVPHNCSLPLWWSISSLSPFLPFLTFPSDSFPARRLSTPEQQTTSTCLPTRPVNLPAYLPCKLACLLAPWTCLPTCPVNCLPTCPVNLPAYLPCKLACLHAPWTCLPTCPVNCLPTCPVNLPAYMPCKLACLLAP